MRNPKQFAATPVDYSKVIDKSHSGTKELVHNGTRTEKLTPHNHFKATPHSAPNAPVTPQKWHKKYSLDSQLS